MKQQSIGEIQARLTMMIEDGDPFIRKLEQDERIGVQKLLARWKKKRRQEEAERSKFKEMTKYELTYRTQGFSLIAGIDEVGRGPLAGPVAAAAVILPEKFYLPGIDDSKKLSEKKRLEFDEIIRREALAFNVAMIHAEEIDEINIYEAAKKAMKAAIAGLNPGPDFLLIDAMKLETPHASESIIKGDAKSISIAAASIVAKVARDEWMKKISLEYPAYHFDQNMGYGTKEHLLAIKLFGITPLHRKSFSPVKEQIEQNMPK